MVALSCPASTLRRKVQCNDSTFLGSSAYAEQVQPWPAPTVHLRQYAQSGGSEGERHHTLLAMQTVRRDARSRTEGHRRIDPKQKTRKERPAMKRTAGTIRFLHMRKARPIWKMRRGAKASTASKEGATHCEAWKARPARKGIEGANSSLSEG